MRQYRTKLTTEERFFTKVVCSIASGCWEWTGLTKEGGYGLFPMRGPDRWRHKLAHRYSWMLHNGPIPNGLWVLHHCDNPPCTRPDHLFLGTHADNMTDASLKGRTSQGDNHHTRRHPEKLHRDTDHHMTKITDDQVRELRGLHVEGLRPSDLALRFSISRSRVSDLLHGRGRIF